MGMAASQARLLAITARIHDVEYQAQSLQNAKLQLSTQSDQVYNEYLEALDATTLTISTFNNDGSSSKVTANFNTLCSKNKVQTANGNDYMLLNKNGLLVVENDVCEAYEEFKAQGITDPYAFAMYMITGDENSPLGELGASFVNNLKGQEELTYRRRNENAEIEALHQELTELCLDPEDIYSGPKNDELTNAYNAKLESFRKEMYRLYSEDLFINVFDNENVPEFNNDHLNHYMNVFNQILACGGCVSINDYDGLNGDASSNSEWLQAMIESGRFSIRTIKTNSDGEKEIYTTSPSSDSALGFTETTAIDKTALAKAEAKYDHDLKEIDKKDKQYDLTLAKLETERTALTTEYDSVKKVIEDNIERTFGIFS